jgi:CBS domain-containing protein
MPRTIRMIIEDQAPVTAPEQTTVAEAARLMQLHGVGAVMVVKNDKLVGIITERDALYKVMAKRLDAESTRIADVMTRNPQTIHPDKPFEDALRIMHASSFRHVPVVENGRPVGMVSARDALGPELEAFIHALLRQSRIADIPTIPVKRDL